MMSIHVHNYCFALCTAESHNIGLSAAISTSIIIVIVVSVMCVICLILKVHRRKKMPGNLLHLKLIYDVQCTLISKFSLLQVLLTLFIGNKM